MLCFNMNVILNKMDISIYKFYCTVIINIQIIKMSAESKIQYNKR